MKASANRRVDAALNCEWTEGNSTGGAPGRNSQASPAPGETEQEADTATFSRQSRRQNEADIQDGNEGLRRFLALLEYSNEKIEEMARGLEPLKVEPRAVPSGIGMALGDASARLKMADLKVRNVVQEYSASVPAGCVIAQVPGPGSMAAKRSGVRLIVSKGPPPQEEKHDVLRKRDKVPYHGRESRDGFQRAAPAAAGSVVGYTACGTVPAPDAPIPVPETGDGE